MIINQYDFTHVNAYNITNTVVSKEIQSKGVNSTYGKEVKRYLRKCEVEIGGK